MIVINEEAVKREILGDTKLLLRIFVPRRFAASILEEFPCVHGDAPHSVSGPGASFAVIDIYINDWHVRAEQIMYLRQKQQAIAREVVRTGEEPMSCTFSFLAAPKIAEEYLAS